MKMFKNFIIIKFLVKNPQLSQESYPQFLE